jgi:hypothetical protein
MAASLSRVNVSKFHAEVNPLQGAIPRSVLRVHAVFSSV